MLVDGSLAHVSLLITSIAANNFAELQAAADRAWAEGTGAVEIRLDAYDEDVAPLAEYLRSRGNRTWIVTCRSAAEGGTFRGDTNERIARLLGAAGGTGAFVDFELADWRRSEKIRRKIRLAAARPDGDGYRLILSAHDFCGPPDEPAALVREMIEVSVCSVAKVAFSARTICDSFAALDLMHEHRAAVITVAMGEAGLWTRVLAGKMGAFATYAAVDADSATAPGQIALGEMIGQYRWPRLSSSTRLFGVLGDPVAHSMSPLLFNRWFADAAIDAVYLPLSVERGGDTLGRFLDGCRARPWLDVGGFSVTLPHKAAALRWVGEGADPPARRVGAINTLVFDAAGVRGFNTDCPAARDSIVETIGGDEQDLAGAPVDILGTGGAARAVVAGLVEAGCRITVYGRSPENARCFASDYSAECRPWDQRSRRTGRILINCTDVGMWPRVDESPMPPDAFDGCRLVFDVVYNPLRTRLLRDAERAGIKTLSGLEMFIRQAARQFELWTSKTPDTRAAREIVARELRRRTQDVDGSAGDKEDPSRGPSHFTSRSDVKGGKAEPDAGGKIAPSRSRLRKALPGVKGRRSRLRKGLPDTPRDPGANALTRSIVLIGFRGCGKSMVGRALADLLGVDFVDTDELISTRAGMTIAAIFAQEGERGFRRREREVVEHLVAAPPAVISVGGGAVLDPRNVAALKKVATLVWLTAPAEVLRRRMAGDPDNLHTRPPLTDLPGREEVEHVLAARTPLYQKAADWDIDTTQSAPPALAAAIARRLGLLRP